MKGDGVPFAVTPEGNVADPATAPKLAYFYTCLDCGTHVRVRRGSKRAAHFAHYAETRGGFCTEESVLHKASKRLLAEYLAGFPDTLTLVQPCQGHESVDGGRVSCTNTARIEVALPAYDQVTLEQVFGRQRLDVALLQAGAVVMGFEIYYAHEVSEAKARALGEAGLPWLELEAVRKGEPAVWRPRVPFKRSCGVCDEYQKLRDAERDRQRRTVPYAFSAVGLVHAQNASAETAYACPACGALVSLDTGGRAPALLHEGDAPCSQNEVTMAAAWFLLSEALAEPEQIRVASDCRLHYDGCEGRRLEAKRLSHHQFRRSGERVLVFNGGKQVATIQLTRNTAQLSKRAAEATLRLNIKDLIDDPFVWQFGKAHECESCQDHHRQFRHVLQPRPRSPAAHKGDHDIAKLSFVKSYLERFGVDPKLAGHCPLVVTKSSCCNTDMVFVTASPSRIPAGLEPLFWRSKPRSFPYNRCPTCRKGLLPEFKAETEARTLMLTYRVWFSSQNRRHV